MKCFAYAALLFVVMLVSPAAAQTVVPVATNVTIPPSSHIDYAVDVSAFTDIALLGVATPGSLSLELAFGNTPGSLFSDGSPQGSPGGLCALNSARINCVIGNSFSSSAALIPVTGRFLLLRVTNGTVGTVPSFFSLEVFGRQISAQTFPIPLPVIIAPKK